MLKIFSSVIRPKVWKKILLGGQLVLFLFFSSWPYSLVFAAEVEVAQAPQVLSLVQGQVLTSPQLTVSGRGQNGTRVSLYLNDYWVGSSDVVSGANGWGSFTVKLTKPLTNGYYKLTSYAQFSEVGAASSVLSAEVVSFKVLTSASKDIEKGGQVAQSPKIYPVLDDQTTEPGRPLFRGRAESGSVVKVYLDNQYLGKTLVPDHQSGWAYFIYEPEMVLTPGGHQVYYQVVSPNGSQVVTTDKLFFDNWSGLPGEGVAVSTAPVLTDYETVLQPKVIKYDQGYNKNLLVVVDESEVEDLEEVLPVVESAERGVIEALDQSQNGSRVVKEVPLNSVATSEVKSPQIEVAPITSNQVAKLNEPAEGEVKGVTIKKPVPDDQKSSEEVVTDDVKEDDAKADEKSELTFENDGEFKGDDPVEVAEDTPLVLGLIVLAVLVVSFISWYFGQQRELVNQGINKLFADEEADDDEGSESEDTAADEEDSDDQPLENKDDDQSDQGGKSGHSDGDDPETEEVLPPPPPNRL